MEIEEIKQMYEEVHNESIKEINKYFEWERAEALINSRILFKNIYYKKLNNANNNI